MTDGKRFLTLRGSARIAEGVVETVLRRGFAQLSGSGLMPEGMENAITVEQMADLIAFLFLPP